MPDAKPSSASGCKRCPKCRESKQATTEFFKPDSRTPTGLSSWCRACQRDAQRERRQRQPDKDWNLPKYQLPRYRAAKKLGECVICGEPAQVVDHDHKTGHIRGGLCQNCNTGLGMFRDDHVLLELAALYIQGRCACGDCQPRWGGLQIVE